MNEIKNDRSNNNSQFELFDQLVKVNSKLKEEILVRKNTEIKLVHSEEKYRSIISNMELGLVEVDIYDTITNVNDRLNKMTGYDNEELIGKKYIDFFLDDESKKVMKEENARRKNGKNGVYEVKLRKKNGDWLWIIISGAPLYDENKKVIGTIGTHLDITERKLMEQELVKAKNIAEEVADVKSHFLANMSHEVRTPMNGIIGLTKLLLNTELNPKQKEYLNAIDISSNTLVVVVNDILDISKIEAGKMTFENKKFKLIDLISSVVDVFESKAAEKNIDLEFFIDDNIPEYIIGDSIRLNQILYNLINNAIKFTPKGKVTVKVDEIEHSKKSTYLNISIIDTGIGITKKSQKKIFDVFTQAKENTTRKFGGTGLGLTIVKKLVELQGGIIDLHSIEHKGSTFSVKLEFQTPNKENDVREKHSLKLNDYSSLEGLNILLAEDNSINQLLINDLLQNKKIIIKIVSDGQQAVDCWLKNDFDLILMDMQMPIKDGYEAMQEIRISPISKKRNTPILALTAHATEGEREKCINAGADNYLSKPFQPEQLLHMIERMTIKKEEISLAKIQTMENFDIKTLRKFTNDNQELIISTLHLLSETLADDENSLLNAWRNDNRKVLKSIAHRMKPNLYLLGLKRLGEFCDDICGTDKPLNETKELSKIIIDSIPVILNDIKIELKNMRQSLD
jgi:PAS domain S-box-containing protein